MDFIVEFWYKLGLLNFGGFTSFFAGLNNLEHKVKRLELMIELI